MQTLVLDAYFQPIGCVPWQRAVGLIFSGKAEAIEEYEVPIRSATLTIKTPSIVRFFKAGKRVKFTVKFNRANVYARDNHQCQYCGKVLSPREATYDHVTPRAQGGKTYWDNVVTCCRVCNQNKGNQTPEQARMTLLAKPIRPRSLPFHGNWRPEGYFPPEWQQWVSKPVGVAV